MPNSQANLSKAFLLWLFIATMSLQVLGKNSAEYIIAWRSTGNLADPNGEAELLLEQESKCKTKDKDINFSALFTSNSLPTKWRMDMTHSEDSSFTDHEGRCRARSKVTLAISQGPVSFHIRLNHLCSDEACDVGNLSGDFSCGIIKAPKDTEQFFGVNLGKKQPSIKCTR